MKYSVLITLAISLFTISADAQNESIYVENSHYGLKDKLGNTLIEPVYDDLVLIEPNGIYKGKEDELWGLISEKGKKLTAFKYSQIKFFQKGYATFIIMNSEGYGLFSGYLDTKGKEFVYPYLTYESLNWNIKNAPSEIPDSSFLLGSHSYLNFTWSLKTLLNHNLKAFVQEPQSYPDLEKLDAVCIGYGMLISGGNYSEDYMYENPKSWESFKNNTVYKILANETLRELSWQWIKPYYKDAFKKMNPFVKRTYKDCFKYLKQHIDTFDKAKYQEFLDKNEEGFAKFDLNGKRDSKRKLSAFVDRLILKHGVISVEDSKRWINKLYDEVKHWK